MHRYAIAYVVTGGVFLCADYIWLTRAMGFYRSSLGRLLAGKPNLAAAAVLYLIYVVGIVVFAVLPAASNEGWISAPLLGGLVAFATYALTNLATLNRWPLLVAFIDMAWGMFVTAFAALAGVIAIRTLLPRE